MDTSQEDQSINSVNAATVEDGANTVNEDNTSKNVAKSDQPISDEKDSQGPSMDPANLTYEGEICIYTDPDTKYQFRWDEASHQWKPHNQQPGVDAASQSKPPGGEYSYSI